MASVHWKGGQGRYGQREYREADLEQPLDPKVPSFNGHGGHVELRQWMRLAKAFALSLGNQESAAGPKLLLNLRGEAADLASDIEPETLIHDDDIYNDAGEVLAEPKKDSGKNKGWRRLLRFFQDAYPEGTLKKLPRVYRDFFVRTCLEGNDLSAMDRYLNMLEKSRRELERADHTNISLAGTAFCTSWLLALAKHLESNVPSRFPAQRTDTYLDEP